MVAPTRKAQAPQVNAQIDRLPKVMGQCRFEQSVGGCGVYDNAS